MIDRIRPFGGFDYVQAGDPTIDVNPNMVGVSWLNITSGELFICTDVSTDSNIWKGQLGSVVTPALDHVFDIFNDNSTYALYRLNETVEDEGDVYNGTATDINYQNLGTKIYATFNGVTS